LSDAGPALAALVPADEGKRDPADPEPRGARSPDRQLRLDGLTPCAPRKPANESAPPKPAPLASERARRAMPKGRNFH
jgi:hypothetical protein